MLFQFSRHRKSRQKSNTSPEEKYRRNAVQLEQRRIKVEYDIMRSLLRF